MYNDDVRICQNEIRRLHSVCREYNEEICELKRVIKSLIILVSETREEDDPSKWLLEQTNLDKDLYNEIMNQE